MTNPVGYAFLPGGVSSDGQDMPGLQAVYPPGGAPTTGSGEQLHGIDPSYFALQDASPTVDLTTSYSYTSTVAQTLAGYLVSAGITYCTIRAGWGQSVGGFAPSVNFTVSMAGFGALDVGLDASTGDPFGLTRTAFGMDSGTGVNKGIYENPLPAPYQMWMPSGALLRPTPLTWAGQDPDNVANRAVWRASEIAAISYALTAVGVARYPGYGLVLDPFYVMVPLSPMTGFPIRCSITPFPTPTVVVPPTTPSTVAAGAADAGVRPRCNCIGSGADGVTVGAAAGGGVTVGATYYNDPPPGAGDLSAPGYHFAELGTARRTDGGGTGVGWAARALGMPGELPMGFALDITYGGRTITADKQDRGYGQGGDGVTSDPAYAIDLYDGSASGLANAPGALGFPGKGNAQIRAH